MSDSDALARLAAAAEALNATLRGDSGAGDATPVVYDSTTRAVEDAPEQFALPPPVAAGELIQAAWGTNVSASIVWLAAPSATSFTGADYRGATGTWTLFSSLNDGPMWPREVMVVATFAIAGDATATAVASFELVSTSGVSVESPAPCHLLAGLAGSPTFDQAATQTLTLHYRVDPGQGVGFSAKATINRVGAGAPYDLTVTGFYQVRRTG